MTTPAALSRDLEAVGVDGDLWGLVNSKARYRAAVPVLLDWLRHVDERVPEPDLGKVREGLVRALTVPEARPVAAPELIRQFQEVDELTVRWAIGNALSVVYDDSVFDQLEPLVREPRFGQGRQMLVHGLGRSRHPRAPGLLVELLSDDDVAAHALTALTKLKPPGVRGAVEPLLDHPRPLVRKNAKKALEKLP
ncbi:HEAT repeat domain-containing protein [Amycolatopsis sp. cg5]|uniref:HEAT repeat domain-containing protein n=1 Tax=Amycolatopsis sp. cg5 TaxID=3238802 RepID=UPI0035250FE1